MKSETSKLKVISNLFEGSEIRSVWDSEKEDYYFSVVDVIKVLTDSAIPRRYWTDLKKKLVEEGSQLYDNIVQLKLKSSKDGKMYKTDTLDTKGIFRLIESVPSPKAEPFKIWLANLGKENINLAKVGGSIAKNTRKDIENKLNKNIITNKNNLNYEYLKENDKIDMN